jgi:hypothetical protein
MLVWIVIGTIYATTGIVGAFIYCRERRERQKQKQFEGQEKDKKWVNL